jgi:beta-N-acetylhexosaminidase
VTEDPQAGRRLTRRQLLRLAGWAGLAALLASCGLRPSASGSVPAGPTRTIEPSPTPQPATPGPAVTPTPGPTLREKIGQMLLVGFRGLTVAQATAVVADIREQNLGGVLLFDTDQPTGSSVRNIQSPAQLTALVSGLQALAATPLMVAVDEEGGLVARLGPDHGFPATVSAADLGARDDPAYTRQRGAAIARTLHAAGVNLNLAPVVDLDINPANPAIGAVGRSFSADPAVVTSMAEAFIRGHHDVGVLTTIKHFPGQGSAAGDTHVGVVDVSKTWSRTELQPFANVISGGLADAVLTAHVFNASLDPQYPATLSSATVTGILREQLGWEGLVISDDMQMGAIRQAYGYADAVRLAIHAGIDVLTIAQQQVFEVGIVAHTVDIIAGLVADGTIALERIDQSYARITDFKARMLTSAG